MDELAILLLIIPLAPLLASVIIACTAPRLLRRVPLWPGYVTVFALAVSSASSLLLLREISFRHQYVKPNDPQYQRVIELWDWADVQQALWLRPSQPDAHPAPAMHGWRDFRVSVALRADGLTAMMLATVTVVSLIVAIFSIGYMKGDRGYWRYFSYFSLFVFSMTMLVSASNFLLLYVFWEAVGLCSYLLIGFWYEKPSASAAAKKAFLVNRVGDFGFALALMLIWITYGTLDFHATVKLPDKEKPVPADSELILPAGSSVQSGVLDHRNGHVAGGTVGLAICLLLLLGACGKSAQFPLHVWLPDAMEGPTPVSALIHAATMVTAGVYMIARCTPLFVAVPEAQLIVAGIGAFTALLAAVIAVTQFDLKRVLAYSTISQLGYMFLALGVGTFAGITSAMFHLFTHAFFKALLFLGAGSVMHAMGNVIDMRQFGGLRRVMPITHWTFLVGCLALGGVFPLSGFWSKDAILGSLHDRMLSHSEHSSLPPLQPGSAEGEGAALSNPVASHNGPGWYNAEFARQCYRWCYYAALLTTFLTAFYTFRAFFMTFYGEYRTPPDAEGHVHESPPVMAVPLLILAVGAAVAGFLVDFSYTATISYLPGGRVSSGNMLADFIGYSPSLAASAITLSRHSASFHLDVAITSMILALAGLGLAMFFYLESRREAEWLSCLLAVEWYHHLLDPNTVAAMRRWKWVVATNKIAQHIGLGWLVRCVGFVALAALWIISIPLMLAYYFSPYRLSVHRFYFDQLYQWTIVLPLRALARLCSAVDRWLVDATVDWVARVPVWVGNFMRSLQMGVISFYALSMLLGAVILLLVRLMWGA